jgi:hypothetical protein
VTRDEIIALAAFMTTTRAKALQERTAALEKLITDDSPVADKLRTTILEINNRLDEIMRKLESPTLTAYQGMTFAFWIIEGEQTLDVIEPILRMIREARS